MDDGPFTIAAKPPGQRAPRILVVAANRGHLGILARRLAEAGFRVTTADSGASAVAELNRTQADLVITDLRMPRMSGAELIRLLRGEAQWHDLPVLAITGRSDRQGAIAAYQAGADDVIIKPFHFELLFARIARQIARAAALRELRDDKAALDARIVTRAIELGEMREQLVASEAERRRLAMLVRADA